MSLILTSHEVTCPECNGERTMLFPVGAVYIFDCLECGYSDQLRRLQGRWRLVLAGKDLKRLPAPNPDGSPVQRWWAA